MVAAAAMALSSISVIANSSLLKRLKIKELEGKVIKENEDRKSETYEVTAKRSA